MRIIFRATASKQMGSGHIMRCLALAEAVCKEDDTIVEFVTQKYPENLDDLIKKKGFIVHSLDVLISGNEEGIESDIFDQEKDANDTIKAIKSNKVDWIIIDHYSLDYKWEEKLRRYTMKIMVIDDLANRKHNCDILLDQNYTKSLLVHLVIHDWLLVILKSIFSTVWLNLQKSELKYIKWDP